MCEKKDMNNVCVHCKIIAPTDIDPNVPNNTLYRAYTFVLIRKMWINFSNLVWKENHTKFLN